MDNKLKNKITEEWLLSFPNLRPFAQNRLYKIIGCYIVGLELIKLPRVENYRPHFVLYPLYKQDVQSCLQTPVLIYEFYNEKRLQLNLPYNDPNNLFKNAQRIITESLKFKFDRDITLSIFNSLPNYDLFENSDNWYKTHSGKRASLYEIKFYASLYTGNDVQVQNALNQILEEKKVGIYSRLKIGMESSIYGFKD